ncbi:MAG: methyltransferase family protein [Pyrinomonadaceae bacterium]
MDDLTSAERENDFASRIYRKRAVVGNMIVFLGFGAILLDPFAGITLGRLLAGLTVGLLGFALRIWASSYQWHNIARPLPEARTGLITAGPYSLMRHPIYSSMLLLTVGIFLAFGSWFAAALAVIPTIVLNYWQAKYEETFLVERYGSEAREYQHHLPIFIPQIWDPFPVKNGTFSFLQGIKHDIGPLSAFVCFGLVMVFVAVRQKATLTITLIVLVVSVLFSFLLTWLIRSIFKQEFVG